MTATTDPPVTKQRGRLRELDALRGIAVIVVVIYHFGPPFNEFFPGRPEAFFSFPQGRYGVELFFLISGFVILLTAWRSHHISDYVIARATRLYPPYWVGLTLTVLAIALAGPPSLKTTGVQVAANYTMLQRFLLIPDVDRVYWTLAIELIFYFYVFVLLVVTRNRLTPRVIRIFVTCWVLVALGVAVWSQGVEPSTMTKILTSVTAAQYAPLFSVGVLTYMTKHRGRFEWLIVPGVVLIFVHAWLMDGREAAVVSTCLALLFLAVVLPEGVAAFRWRPLVWFGSISYPLYLVHMNIGWIVMNRLLPWMSRPCATAVAMLVVVLLAWAMHRTVEGPASRAMRRWLTARRDHLTRATGAV